MWPMDDFPEINVHSYIGVIIAISGNILISVALNIQKYAHNQLQPTAVDHHPKLVQSPIAYAIEEEESESIQCPPAAPALYRDNGSVCTYQSTDSSHGSSTSRVPRSIHSDTSEQSDTLARPVASVDGFYSESSSDTDYLHSKAWWAGMVLMILGECGNFLAYGYAQASIIAPLGTVALVSNVILAPLMLREPFRSRDLGGIVIAIIGTVVVVVNSKESEIKLTPETMVAALLQTQFMIYFVASCIAVAVLASLSETIGPDYIFIDLSIVAIFGGYTVLATKGVSSLLSLSFYKMFTYPIAYLLVFVLVTTAVLQIKYLNKSLQRFDSTQVIPTQFVLFTTSAIIGSAILYNDFDEMDFNKGLHFLTGCCMTFLGVYFITSQRETAGPTAPMGVDAEWIMTPQQQYVPVHRSSIDLYPPTHPIYQLDRNRSELYMEQGQTSSQGHGGIYTIPAHPSRPPRSHTHGPESMNASVPLLGTSSMNSSAPNPREAGFSLASSMHNVFAAVGARHTSSLGLDKVVQNYLVQRGEERRGSIHSIQQQQQHPFYLQRPPMGSRSSSACSGAV